MEHLNDEMLLIEISPLTSEITQQMPVIASI